MGIIQKKDIWLFFAQAAIWLFILLLMPLAVFMATRSTEPTLSSMRMVWNMLHSPLILYFINFYLLGPWLFSRRHYIGFVVCNILLFVGINYGLFFHNYFTEEVPVDAVMGFYTGMLVYILLNCAMIAAALVVRHTISIRRVRQQIQEEKAKNTEAELAWLKNQINPHFLFNTLNNISSLTQIDPDAAQDVIAQLSDLLRYAIYETNKPLVPIQGEVDFMHNYISLMKLRCNERTEVTESIEIEDPQTAVAPLLFISLIENAFKHGVSSNKPSAVNIFLRQKEGLIEFTCDNTNYPKDTADHSGSGIGLENTRRRLDLVYAGRYDWQQSLTDNVYHVKITISL